MGWALGLIALAAWSVAAQDVTVVVNLPPGPLTAGSPCVLWLNFLNPTTNVVQRAFPTELEVRWVAGSRTSNVVARLTLPSSTAPATIAPGAFARQAYEFIPPEYPAGNVTLEFPQVGANGVMLTVQAPAPTVAVGEPKSVAPSTGPPQPPHKPLPTAVVFFKEHFFPYEPFYFIAGPDSPSAKFQVSFKYRILNSDGALAEHLPPLTGFHVGYTQTSLWDLNRPSAPFLDSSYKPELLYSLERVDRGKWADWFRLDLQAGAQHESNGREGAESRSLNIAYLRTAVQFGKENHLQLTLIPRAWVYLTGLDENPNLPRYRGYVDLRTVLGWEHGLQLSSIARMGDDAEKGSLQLDLSYPMSRLLSGSFSLYLHAQYFTGYGESLLYYNERSSIFRAGISLFR